MKERRKVTLGQQYNNTGEKPTVVMYTYINRHAGTLDKNKTKAFLVHDKTYFDNNIHVVAPSTLIQ